MKATLYKEAQKAITTNGLKHGDTFKMRNSAGTEYFFYVNGDGRAELLVTSITIR